MAKVQLSQYILQIAQDTLSFRNDIPIWSLSLSKTEEIDVTPICELLNITNDQFLNFHLQDVSKSFGLIKNNVEHHDELIKKLRNSIHKTSYSNHDPLVSLFKEFTIWRIWEFYWSLSVAKHIINEKKLTGVVGFGGNWQFDENEIKFFDFWKVKFQIHKELDAILFYGPFYTSNYPLDLPNDQLVIDNITTGLQYLLEKFGTTDNQFSIPLKMMKRIALLRPVVSIADFCSRVDRTKECLKYFSKIHVILAEANEFQKKLLLRPSADLVSGLIGFIDFLICENLLDFKGQITFKLPSMVDDNGKIIDYFWCKYEMQKFVYFASFTPPTEHNKRSTNRLFVKPDTSIDNGFVEMIDKKMSYHLSKVRRARFNFRNEQARIARGALNELSGSWLQNDIQDEFEDRNPWNVFKRASPILATLCFRLLRADICHLYAFEDGEGHLKWITSVHNNKTKTTVGNIQHEISDRNMLRGKSINERKARSIAYRCLYDSTQSHDSKRDFNSDLWVKNYIFDKQKKINSLVVTDVYCKEPGSEIAVELSAHGRVWGVIIVTGYQPFHFESSAMANLESIARLFSAQLFKAWFLMNLELLANNVLGASSKSQIEFDGIATIIGQITLTTAVALWVDEFGDSLYVPVDTYKRQDIEKHKNKYNSRYVYRTDKSSRLSSIITEHSTSKKKVTPWILDKNANADPDALEYLLSKKLNYAYIASLKTKSGTSRAFLTIHTTAELSPSWINMLEFLASYLGSTIQVLFETRQEMTTKFESYAHSIRQVPEKLLLAEKELSEYLDTRFGRESIELNRLTNNIKMLTSALDRNLKEAFDGSGLNQLPIEYRDPFPDDLRAHELLPVNELIFGVLSNYPKKDRFIGRFTHFKNLGIYATKEPIATILINYLDNAQKYKLEGSKLRVNFYESHNTITIRISNLGLKLSQLEKQLLFAPGFRGSNVKDTDEGKGAGLGICMKIAEEWKFIVKYKPQEISQYGAYEMAGDNENALTSITTRTETLKLAENSEWHHFDLTIKKDRVEQIKEN